MLNVVLPRNRNGHACMLQYALLHLYGYELSIDDLKNFRVSETAYSSHASVSAI